MKSSWHFIPVFLCIAGLASHITGASPSRYSHHRRIRFVWPEEGMTGTLAAADSKPVDLAGAGALGQYRHLGEIRRLIRDVEMDEALRRRQRPEDDEGQGQKEASNEDDDDEEYLDKVGGVSTHGETRRTPVIPETYFSVSGREVILPKSKRMWELTGMDVVSQIIRGIEKQQRQQEMMRKG